MIDVGVCVISAHDLDDSGGCCDLGHTHSACSRFLRVPLAPNPRFSRLAAGVGDFKRQGVVWVHPFYRQSLPAGLLAVNGCRVALDSSCGSARRDTDEIENEIHDKELWKRTINYVSFIVSYSDDSLGVWGTAWLP